VTPDPASGLSGEVEGVLDCMLCMHVWRTK
jgi:hypothetical protein